MPQSISSRFCLLSSDLRKETVVGKSVKDLPHMVVLLMNTMGSNPSTNHQLNNRIRIHVWYMTYIYNSLPLKTNHVM